VIVPPAEEAPVITSIFPTIGAADVEVSRDFYVGLLGFRVVFDSGWYVQLEAPTDAAPQIGIVERDHASIPSAFRAAPAGVLVSVEVDDVDAVHARAVGAGLEIALGLRDEDFGQRHFMTVDPDGILVDVITPIPPGAEYADQYLDARG
jgi:catechol 2,3-dioxygenase-like lactoylglutathione lyase family enzyme